MWLVPHVSPVCLVAAIAAPLIGLAAAVRLGRTVAFPIARGVAYFAVTAPPLFSFLGGWLDFQHMIPVGSLGVWLVLWALLVIAVLFERERTAPSPPAPSQRRLAVAHGVSAIVIIVFSIAHLINHLSGLAGGATHEGVMRSLRIVYRHPVIEPVLAAALVFQVVSGLWLVRRKCARALSSLDTLQVASGTYLAMFLASHVSAVLRTRYLYGADTNWTWLAGGELLTDPWSARLVPYYFLAVIALGLHAASGLRTVLIGHGVSAARSAVAVAVIGSGAMIVSSAIMVALFRA